RGRSVVLSWDELTTGRDLRRGKFADRALVDDVELGHPVDLVAEAVDSQPRLERRGKDIENSTAYGELALMLDLVLAAIAEADELFTERGEVDHVADGEDERL